jgi:hypothetical protein
MALVFSGDTKVAAQNREIVLTNVTEPALA